MMVVSVMFEKRSTLEMKCKDRDIGYEERAVIVMDCISREAGDQDETNSDAWEKKLSDERRPENPGFVEGGQCNEDRKVLLVQCLNH